MPSTDTLKASLNGKWIWITGSTSGIGYSLAQAYVNLGANVILNGRSRTKVDALLQAHPNQAYFVAADFSQAIDIESLRKALSQITQVIDILILNAGICEYLDDPKALSLSAFEPTFRVNYFGLLASLEAALPLLETAQAPHILAMSSAVALFHGFPRAEAYGASKAAIKYTFEGLQAVADKIHPHLAISLVYPGFVKTPLTDKNDFPMPMRISSEEAADIIIQKSLERPLEIAFPFWFIVWTRLFNGILPKTWLVAMLKRIHASRKNK